MTNKIKVIIEKFEEIDDYLFSYYYVSDYGNKDCDDADIQSNLSKADYDKYIADQAEDLLNTLKLDVECI